MLKKGDRERLLHINLLRPDPPGTYYLPGVQGLEDSKPGEEVAFLGILIMILIIMNIY